MKPIIKWLDLIKNDMKGDVLRSELQSVYRSATPGIAEVVLQSYCPNSCLHCIYPPDYHKHNRTLNIDDWLSGLDQIYDLLGIRRYIFGGRHLDQAKLDIIKRFKSSHRDIQIGLIMDGSNLSGYLEPISALRPDWLDISLDGPESVHDRQRNRPGDFEISIGAVKNILEKGQIHKINILTCLTTLNLNSVLEMVYELNNLGVKNFFFSPVVIVEGVRPDPCLKIDPKELSVFFENLLVQLDKFHDSWIEISLYEPEYLADLMPQLSTLVQGPVYSETTMEWIKPGFNELHIIYYPTSLAGITELILNSDGSIILPKTVAHGRIPASGQLGSIFELSGSQNCVDLIGQKKAIDFYYDMLLNERKWLKNIL